MDDISKFCSLHSGLEAKIDALCEKIDDRDINYRERDYASKEAIKAAFNSSEKASEKTELALKEYKSASNEWRDTVKDLVSRMITRPDVERELKVLEEKITELRGFRNNTEGRESEKDENRIQTNWSTSLIVVTIIATLSFIATIINMFIGK